MKFTFDRDLMIKEVSIAQEIISTKNASSVLSNILLNAYDNRLTIKATDIKLNFATQIPVQIIEEGSTTIYCDKFLGILNSLPSGEIEFLLEENQETQSLNVKICTLDRKNKFEMRCLYEDKFPDFTTADDAPYFEVSSKEIKEMIAQTIIAVSDDETRYHMNGVFFEKRDDSLNLVSTDGRRLSFASKKILAGISDFPSSIVHPKLLNIILKHAPEEGNIFIAIVDKMIFCKFGNYKFGGVLIEGVFPRYEGVIPQHQEHCFLVQKSDLSNALKSVSQMVDKKVGRIYYNISDGILKISAQQTNFGSADAEIPCMYAGESHSIALNFRYVEEPLRVIDTEVIAFEFTEEMKAVTIRPEPAGDYFHVVMPMQKE